MCVCLCVCVSLGGKGLMYRPKCRDLLQSHIPQGMERVWDRINTPVVLLACIRDLFAFTLCI
jgi:hypothetical protein